jgi:PhnB protein
MAVKPIPEGYHSVTPYLTVQDGNALLEFYKQAFSAVELVRMGKPGDKIHHAEIRIGDSNIMFSDEFPEMDARSPRSVGGTASFLMIYTENADAMVERAVAAGARLLRPVQNQFYGDRSGMIEDPAGHRWVIATHIEDVPPAEMERRAAEAMAAT